MDGEQPKRWAVVHSDTIKMTEGEGVVVVPAKNGLVWVAVKRGPDYFGNAFKPAAARDLARSNVMRQRRRPTLLAEDGNLLTSR